MKKTSILMAMFALIAAASAAKAEAPAVDFDGKFKTQSMHDIFAESHQLIPPGTMEQSPAPAKVAFNPLGSACSLVCVNQQLTADCRCEPYFPWSEDNIQIDWNSITQYIQSGNANYCVAVASGPWWTGCVVGGAPVQLQVANEIPGRSFRSMSAEQKKQLAMYYILQGDLKKAVLAHSAEYNFSTEITAFISAARTRILYDNKKVYIANGRAVLIIADEKLAVEAKGLLAAMPQYNDANNRNYGGIGIIIGCMYSGCWDDVGDAVSDVSEAITYHYYTHGPGAGQQQGSLADMPD